jgi:hypothetical protein
MKKIIFIARSELDIVKIKDNLSYFVHKKSLDYSNVFSNVPHPEVCIQDLNVIMAESPIANDKTWNMFTKRKK